MSVLSLALGLIKLLTTLINWAHERNLMQAGADEVIVKALEGARDEMQRASAARARVRADIAAGKLREPDEDERPGQ